MRAWSPVADSLLPTNCHHQEFDRANSREDGWHTSGDVPTGGWLLGNSQARLDTGLASFDTQGTSVFAHTMS